MSGLTVWTAGEVVVEGEAMNCIVLKGPPAAIAAAMRSPGVQLYGLVQLTAVAAEGEQPPIRRQGASRR